MGREQPARGAEGNANYRELSARQQDIFRDESSCVSAFKAFSDCFCADWPAMPMSNEETAWTLDRALTFETCMATLRRMRRKKAIGADGLGVDMLLAPGVPVRVLQLYYQGLCECALARTFPEAWKRVEEEEEEESNE